MNLPADLLLTVPDSWLGYLSLWMKSKKLFSGQLISSQPCKSRMTQVFFATYSLFRDFQMLMPLIIQRDLSLFASETNFTCTLKWRQNFLEENSVLLEEWFVNISAGEKDYALNEDGKLIFLSRKNKGHTKLKAVLLKRQITARIDHNNRKFTLLLRNHY